MAADQTTRPTVDADIADALQDSAYLAGLKAGWNLGIDNDTAGYRAVAASRRGYLTPITERRRAKGKDRG